MNFDISYVEKEAFQKVRLFLCVQFIAFSNQSRDQPVSHIGMHARYFL